MITRFYEIMNTQVKWKKFIFQILAWLIAEIYLSILGIDNLADYSEFLVESSRLKFEVGLMAITESGTSGDRIKLRPIIQVNFTRK